MQLLLKVALHLFADRRSAKGRDHAQLAEQIDQQIGQPKVEVGM
jgi:hypothetical protein